MVATRRSNARFVASGVVRSPAGLTGKHDSLWSVVGGCERICRCRSTVRSDHEISITADSLVHPVCAQLAAGAAGARALASSLVAKPAVCLIGITFEALFALLKAILLLPARLFYRARP